VNRSPQTVAAGLLAVAALSFTATAAPVQARPVGRRSHHAAAPQRDACQTRGCAGDTGGTPALAPSARVNGKPRRHDHGAPTQTSGKSSDPGPAAPAAEAAPGKRDATGQDTAAVIAAVLATPCANTELTPAAENLALVRSAVLCLINRERAEHGLNPLVVNPRLEGAAEGHCSELIADDYFAHVSPGGETPVDRIRRTGYIPGPSVGYVIGENLAWGTYSLSTPRSIVAAWIASPGHLANILEGQYTETGIGIAPAVPSSLGGGSPGATYAQEFGVIIR